MSAFAEFISGVGRKADMCLRNTGAGISMFFSVLSPLHIFHSKPDASIVFQFPMVLAPNFTVPLFMLAHAFALVKLFTI